MATKLAKKNAQKKRANDDKESHNFLKNDMILIWAEKLRDLIAKTLSN